MQPSKDFAAYPFPTGAANPPTTDPFAPCGVCGHDPKLIVLDPEVWMKIMFAAAESEDWRLRTLIEQAVMGPKRMSAEQPAALPCECEPGEDCPWPGGPAGCPAQQIESAATDRRKRVYMVKRTLVERCFYDPAEIRREFGNPDEGESWEDFVIRVFERFDGSIYGDEFFPGDASPEAHTELEERWDDE